LEDEEVTMPAIAEVLSTKIPRPAPRGSELPTCPVCADSMVAAEASAFLTESIVSYLWTCDTCGYGFVTKHSLKRFACN
jgi:ribosomal protein L37AE/L43A